MEFDFIPFERVRLFIGDASLWYLAEIVLRVVIVYVYTILLLRVLDNSGMKNMNFLDYFIVISLWSASWDVMIYPTVPIVYCLVAITVIVLLKKAILMLNVKFKLVNEAIQADPVRLIYHGKINEDMLKKLDIRKDTFFAMLRVEWVADTGYISRCYMEPTGELSVFTIGDNEQQYKGESTLPPDDVEY